MELDDQLAALAAGELDDDTARALRARAAADPAVARRLARHERLQALLTDWVAPPMSAAAIDRLDAALDEALDDLDDAPLAARPAPTGPLRAVPASEGGDSAASGASDGVVDLGAARERRAARRGLPAWVPGATVAAALLAVVGTGIIGGGLFSASDEATEDSMADAPSSESAEEGMSATGLADDEMASDDAADESMDADMAEEAAPLAPQARARVEVAEGDLLALIETTAATTSQEASDGGADDTGAADDGAAETESGATVACVTEALERDTPEADERVVWRTAEGTYADRDAVFVVIRTPGEDGDRFDVLAYDPADCSLLARDDTTG